MIPETPETEYRTQISTDVFYKTSSTARKLNFDINEIKHLGKFRYHFYYNIINANLYFNLLIYENCNIIYIKLINNIIIEEPEYTNLETSCPQLDFITSNNYLETQSIYQSNEDDNHLCENSIGKNISTMKN